MIFSVSILQSGNNLDSLLEWFVASASILLVVTLLYVFVLSRSPPPEGPTVARIEASAESRDVTSILSSAERALSGGDTRKAVELSVKAVAVSLGNALAKTGIVLEDMNVSDMAYLAQTKATSSPDISQHAYQLNLLHLKAVQSQQVSPQEAQWAISTASWLSQLVASGQIVL
jgi:hypothetical protein